MIDIRRDAAGVEVRELQGILRHAGLEVGADGAFDLITEAAVRAMQSGHGLLADGIVGPKTWRVAQEIAAGPLCSACPPVLRKVIDVGYKSQRDNVHSPNGTCNVTCLAMVAAHYGVTSRRPELQLEDELFLELQTEEARAHFEASYPEFRGQRINPQNVHGMLSWLAQRRGLDARFTSRATWDQIKAEIDAGRPVIVSGLFTGSGHIILLIGFTAAGDLVVHDPYGDWQTGYRSGGNGAARIYRFDDANRVLKEGPDAKWAHFIRRR